MTVRRTAILIIALATNAQFALSQGFELRQLSNVVTSVWNTAAGDFDDDGDNDLLVSSGQPGSVMFWVETLENDQRATHSISVGSGDFRHCATGDFNGDGITDGVVGDFDDSSFVLLTAHGLGGQNPFTDSILRPGIRLPYAMKTADVNSDGFDDLVAAQHNANVVTVFVQQQGQLVVAADVGQIFHPSDLAVVDYDLDGDKDVLVASDGHGIFWLEQTGVNSYQRRSILDNDELAYAVGGGDLDGDGDVDLVAGFRTASLQRIEWYEHGSLTPHVLNAMFGIPRGLEIADYDSDGDLDIAAASADAGVYWWRNDGNRVFTQLSVMGGNGLRGLTQSDYDNDGDADLIVSDYLGSQVTLLRNTLGIPAVISGTIRAATGGAVIPGILVRIPQLGIDAQSDQSGRYSLFTGNGTHTLLTVSPCWADTTIFGVETERAETTVVNITLRRPLLDLQTTSLNMVAQNQVTTLATLPVGNSGDSPLHLTATPHGNFAQDEWLFVTPEEATIPAGETLELAIRIEPDTSNSSGWDYLGSIELRTDACPDSVVDVFVSVFVLDVDDPAGGIPREFGITSVHPNPFNATTTINFSLPRATALTLSVYDLLGREVAQLAQAAYPEGVHSITWNADAVASGVYFLALEAQANRSLQKIVLLK